MPARVRLIALGVAAAATAVVLAWWAWPAGRDDARLDVLIVGDGQVSQASEPLQRRVRELGLAVALIEIDACSALPTLTEETGARSPSVVVLAPSSPGGCGAGYWDEARTAIGGARLVALVQPGVTDETAVAGSAAAGADVADATPLLGGRMDGVSPVADTLAVLDGGAPGDPPRRLPCVWWEDCEPDGLVTVRDADGLLTPAGGERLARTLAGILP